VNLPADEGRVPVGPERLLAALESSAHSLTGVVGRDILIGLAGTGMLGAILSHEFLPPLLSVSDVRSVPAMTVAMTPAHILPERAVRGVAEMWARGMSTGAMMTFLALGVGVTFGHASWLLREHGGRGLARVAAALGVLVVALGFVISAAYPPRGLEVLDSHIFDDYGSPFTHHAFEFRSTRTEIAQMAVKLTTGWPVAAGLLAAVVALGFWQRRGGSGDPFAARLRPVPEGEAGSVARGSLSRPARVAFSGLAGAAVLAFGATVYYPAPKATLDEMQIVYADLFSDLSAKDLRGALSFLDRFEAHAGKLSGGALIRGGSDPESKRLTAELDEQIQRLKAELEAGRREEARKAFRGLSDTFQACRDAYLGRSPRATPLAGSPSGG
jgi:hypothetical protein